MICKRSIRHVRPKAHSFPRQTLSSSLSLSLSLFDSSFHLRRSSHEIDQNLQIWGFFSDLEEPEVTTIGVNFLMITSPTVNPRIIINRSSTTTLTAAMAGSVDDLGGVGPAPPDSWEFLREALQNPRERLSVLRMEQDVEKFIRDPSQQQMEFQQLPTSYLRLAAHRVAQHYSLQSMVLLDNTLPDGSGSRIIVRKTSECRPPLIRLADIPVNIPTEDLSSSVVKVAIKQRPNKRSQGGGGANSNSLKNNSLKSVEERKEEYNRARARIFSSSSSSSGVPGGKQESEPRMQEVIQHSPLGTSKIEEVSVPGGVDVSIGRASVDSSAGSSRPGRSRTEKEPIVRSRSNSRVAIFRDREVERKDPDYDRNYDRYAQRFDPGFGFNGGSYPIQPMYTPVLNYNTEFPQLGSAHRSPISAEHQSHGLPQHLPSPWVAPSSPAGIGYRPPDAMMTPFSPNHAAPHPASTLYMQYPCQRPGMTFIHPREQVHQHYAQSQQQQSDASFGLARPR
ncbi:R3H domain-containing protein, viridiplantae [Cynara cardunculus var. scolymus]|uniref:R3H domain-containing protein, viridiplantae n=1 Tax=Cynara cardunculus var. scolymus TaxID=59895 RepID=A0A118K5U3_CYNCS|nr:R3H domain-containing protein, viridiplantae [Cynara cardunculus var. scolymus]